MDSDSQRAPDGIPVQPVRLTGPGVALRPFGNEDATMAMELAHDPYVPLTGSLPAHADAEQALQWVYRQRGRLAEGVGYAFAIAAPDTEEALGHIGLSPTALDEGQLSAGSVPLTPLVGPHVLPPDSQVDRFETRWALPQP